MIEGNQTSAPAVTKFAENMFFLHENEIGGPIPTSLKTRDSRLG